jgi:ABC-type oligopeptide transport system substrate-binding subunit
LVERSPELDVVPDVARSWEMSEGGRRYVFHLRDDVRWSDKVPVTAGDFEVAWKRVLDPVAGWPYASVLYAVKGARAFHQGQGGSEHVGVRVPDEFTLAVELEEPTSYFLHLLAHPNTYPVPRHAIAAHGETWAEVGNIVTNGPFRLETWKRGESMRLAYNPSYHGQFSGNLGQVELSFPGDRATPGLEMLEKYEANELDVLGLDLVHIPLAAKDRARLRNAAEYVAGPSLHTMYAGFNVSQPPFDDRRVRRAFALATDRETLANEVLRRYDSPATGGLIPPGMPGHSPGIGLPYEPEEARHLLVEAGYPVGHPFLTFELLTTPRFLPVCESLQTQWGETLGVDVRYQAMEQAAFRGRLEREPPHVYVADWMADYPDPDNFLRANPFRRSTRWRNEAYDGLVLEARRVMDQGERMKLYRQADRILVDEAPIVPLAYARFHLLVKPWVSRFLTSAMRVDFWKDVIIEPH